MAGRDVGVRVEGLREFRRDLKRVSPAVNKEVAAELKKVGGDIAAEARSHAPRVSGKYAASIKPYAARGGVSVGSNLPQAGVLHWGGTIRPKGAPITFRSRPVVMDAAERQADRIADRVGDAIESAARRAGWR